LWQGRAAILPLPLWERIRRPHETQGSNAWPKLVRGKCNGTQIRFPTLQTHLRIHADVSAPWFDHACSRSFRISHERSAGARLRAEVNGCLAAADKTRRRAPSNGVSIPELASTAPVVPQPLSSLGQRSCVRYSARPGRNSAFQPPSPEDWPFSRTPRMETYVASPCRSPVPPRPGAPGYSRYGTETIIGPLESVWIFWRKLLVLNGIMRGNATFEEK
jgi:hypothetical protein